MAELFFFKEKISNNNEIAKVNINEYFSFSIKIINLFY